MHKRNSATYSIAKFVVDNRFIIMLLFLIAGVISIFTAGLVNVSDDLYVYLPESTETRQALEAMEGFTTYSTARVMVENIGVNDAQALADEMAGVKNVKSATFKDTEKYYKDRTALIDVSFAGEDNDESTIEALADVRAVGESYGTVSVSSMVGIDKTKSIVTDMIFVGIIAVIIVIVLLLLTSRSYAEVPVFLITFAMAALLQIGTNFFFGTISYISNAVTLILQLALAIDYSVILCNRFAEECRHLEHKEAMVEALSKAITEISASSLTTIGGLVAIMFMQFGIGRDLALVLIKAILFSMLCVFAFMPGVLLVFAKAIDKTKHRNFIPQISALGNFAWISRKIIPPIFIVVLAVAFIASTKTPFLYNYEETIPIKLNQTQQETQNVRDAFGYENMMAVVVPSNDYDTEGAMLDDILQLDHVTSVLGLASVEAIDGYKLIDKITIDEFSKLAELDRVSSEALFAYYGARHSEFDTMEQDLRSYKIPIMDLFLFLYDVAESGDLELDADKMNMIEDLYHQLSEAKLQLQTHKYSRMLVYADVPAESYEASNLIDEIHGVADNYYDEDSVFVAGEATCARDLKDTFKTDNTMINTLSVIFVFLVIVFTFRSAGLAILLIAVIQGSIWINASVPLLTGNYIFFVAYLIVMAIQMGANIDYAIVISNRYLDLREHTTKRAAITGALSGALPTLLTSGSILAIAGFLIGFLSTEATTSAIGIALGSGTFISLFLVMLVLPQMLLWGDNFITKTSFSKKILFRVPPRFEDDFEDLGREHHSN